MGGGAESLLYPYFLLEFCIGGVLELLGTCLAYTKEVLIDMVRGQVQSKILVFDTFGSLLTLNRRSVVFPHPQNCLLAIDYDTMLLHHHQGSGYLE